MDFRTYLSRRWELWQAYRKATDALRAVVQRFPEQRSIADYYQQRVRLWYDAQVLALNTEYAERKEDAPYITTTYQPQRRRFYGAHR